jgi:hypothetical protein
MSTTIIPPAFDPKAYIAKQNEKEHPAATSAVKVEAKVEPKTEPPPPPTDATEPQHRDSRSQRRLLKQLGAAEGRAAALEELIQKGLVAPPAKPVAPVAEDAKPERSKFSSDADFHVALGAWSARQETAKTLGAKEANEQFKAAMTAAQAKVGEDIKLIEDWETVKAEAAEDDRLDYDFSRPEAQTFVALLALSPVAAEVQYHFCKNPDEFVRIMAMKPDDQIATFHRLEGKVEGRYAKPKTEAKKDDKPKPTQAEIDAKKAAPSESVKIHATGGTAASKPAPYLEDGKTVNPAWTAWRNERDARK